MPEISFHSFEQRTTQRHLYCSDAHNNWNFYSRAIDDKQQSKSIPYGAVSVSIRGGRSNTTCRQTISTASNDIQTVRISEVKQCTSEIIFSHHFSTIQAQDDQ